MGLIKTTINSFSSVIDDQWKEYFYCDSLTNNILVKKARCSNDKSSSKYFIEDNIIANGSIISVNEGQCALIVEDGEIIEIVSESGKYIWDTSSSPSIFTGNLSDSVKKSFKEMFNRLQFNGIPSKDQRVYFINLKLIENNLFGTQTPIAFRFLDSSINADFDFHIQCRGRFSYKIVDPIKFFSNITGNVENAYYSSFMLEQLRAEFMNSFGIALSSIASIGIRPSDLLQYTSIIVEEMNKNMSDSWLKLRGLRIVSIVFESINIPEDEQSLLISLQEKKAYSSNEVALGHLNQAKGDALKLAASNKNGSLLGIAGLDITKNMGDKVMSPFINNQKLENNSVETRIKNLDLLKGKISEEAYHKKLEEILNSI
ncbi:SPFH domain-containing protein [Streptococcus uberis]|uniref:SPFH domain-containing protein n=1 Tax=Streptococcaceae TaxID=1300 RepID=UPI001FF19C8C|nr:MULTISPECIES: SPFH domain-containing protein [Streptococcaceae]MCK1191652.1 SPFH domain-containing protein [Streptococcus uberis]